MMDMPTKQIIKYLASISKSLSGINTGIAKLVEETRKNQLTMAMTKDAEADDEESVC